MKKNLLLGIGLAFMVSVINLQAQYNPLGFALNATGSTIASVIVPPVGSVSRVEYVNCKSDLSSAIIQFYTVTNSTSCLQGYTNSTVTLVVAQTNGFASGNIVVIQHVAVPSALERRVLTTMTSATNLVLTVAPTAAFIPGDIVYQETPGASILLGAANVTVGPTPSGVCYSSVYNGANTPLLIDVTGTSACSIYDIAGTYLYPAATALP
jgi:hypothetical protein